MKGEGWTSTVCVVQAILLLSGPSSLTAQPAEVDTAAVIRSALAEFPSENGAMIQVVRGLYCGQEDQCTSPVADTVLPAVANDLAADLVHSGDPLPPCIWNEDVEDGRKGLRVYVSPIRSEQDVETVSVRVECLGGSEATHARFSHSIRYKVEVVEGQWRVTEVLLHVVS